VKTTGKSPIEDLLDSLGSKLNQKTSNNEEVARLLKVILFGIWLLVAVVVQQAGVVHHHHYIVVVYDGQRIKACRCNR
jgi:hypothetical protein